MLDGPSGAEKDFTICTRGAKFICPAAAGSDSTRLPVLFAGEGHNPSRLHARSRQRRAISGAWTNANGI